MREKTERGPDLATMGGLVVVAICLALLAGLLLGTSTRDDIKPKPEPWPGWSVIGITALFLLGILLVALVAYALLRLIVAARASWCRHRHQQRLDDLAVARSQSQLVTSGIRDMLSASRLYPHDAHGRLGALVRQTDHGWQVLNLDAEAGALFLGNHGSVDRLLADPLLLAQLQARHSLEVERARASAAPNLTSYAPRTQITRGRVVEEAPVALNWPDHIMLRDLAPTPPTLADLVLGVTLDHNGQMRSMTAALQDLGHMAIGGSSGWGKSVFLRALTLQLATAVEPCRLALIDLEGVTFSPFQTSRRLLWPVAETEAAATALAEALVEEMDRRKQLYAAHPGVDSLAAYNAADTTEPLTPLVCLIDEATALLSDRSVQGATRILALRARKYGLWLILGGQDWKAASIDSAIRNQLSSRVHFKATSASQSRVLLGEGIAAAIDTPGRAWAQLPGRPLTELQAPMVTVADIGAALAQHTDPEVLQPPRSCG